MLIDFGNVAWCYSFLKRLDLYKNFRKQNVRVLLGEIKMVFA
ncbi:hypothetical protein NVIRPANT_00520 [Pantoea sp. Nvir]|nr:hypothetical protein NVIRPANT_00520 [Pantoea sp. Nvir]